MRSVADPENRLLEIDENNNQVVTYFDLGDGGTEVTERASSPTRA
jgi:subtilase family serine protease